jgi:hypothetical protein
VSNSAGTVTSSVASLTVNAVPDTTPPTISITAPTSGATVSNSVIVTATASDNVGVASVQFQLDGGNVGSLETSAPYSYVWDTTKSTNGSHTLAGIAKDAAGNSTTSTPVTVTVNNTPVDTTPPTISLTAPANGATVSGTVSITATASDNVGVTGVQFEIDGANAGSLVTTAPYSYLWNTTTASNGSHVVTARAQDAAGNMATSTAVTVTVSNTSGGGGTDFATRCASPGVILCQAFTSTSIFGCNAPGCSVDGPSDWNSGIWQGLDIPGVGDTAHMPIIDTTNYAPDHTTPGSLRFIQTGNVGSNNAGAWFTQFCSGNNPSPSTCYFGPGQDFYIQWRQYVNSTALSTNWSGSYSSEGWKQVIIGEGNTCPSCTPSNNYPSHVAYACSPMEFVIQNTVPGAGTPIINRPTGYHSCGDKDNNYEDIFADISAGTSSQDNWNRSNTSSGGCNYPGFSDCKFYVANTWMTFQIHIRPSTWYANNHVYHQNGIFQMWACTTEPPGTACPLIIDTQRSDFALHHLGSSTAPTGPGYDYINSANGVDPVAKYGKIYLLPYQTGLTGNIGSNQAIWWYDDLIVSSQKIPDPKQ